MTRRARALRRRRECNFEDIPGWELPKSWLEAVPREGRLTVRYQGQPVKPPEVQTLRRSLCTQVLLGWNMTDGQVEDMQRAMAREGLE